MPKTAKEMMHVIEDNLHREWIAEASDGQLDEYISVMPPGKGLHEAARAEREKRHFRRISEPHWTLAPTFWISLGVLIVSLGILWVAWQTWKHPIEEKQQTPNEKAAPSKTNSVSEPTNSIPVKAAVQPILPLVTNIARDTNP